MEPSRDFLGMLYTWEVGTLSMVHLFSAFLTVRDAKLFEADKEETTATVFWVFDIFFLRH